SASASRRSPRRCGTRARPSGAIPPIQRRPAASAGGPVRPGRQLRARRPGARPARPAAFLEGPAGRPLRGGSDHVDVLAAPADARAPARPQAPLRPAPGGAGGPDRPSTFTVDHLADDSLGSGTSGSLRYALGQVASGDTITFGVTGTINLTAALPELT